MRRPRGPGGRFLTAEEIAAQKAAQAEAANPDNDPVDDEDVYPSPDSEQPLSPITRSSTSYALSEQESPPQHHQPLSQHHQQLLDMAYHHNHHRHPVPLSQSLANVTSSMAPSHPPPMYANHKSPIGHEPMPIGTPYGMQMHHPLQRQHHHPAYSPYAIYPPDPLRSHEMMHFGTTGVPSP
jgi:hypothetical protein